MTKWTNTAGWLSDQQPLVEGSAPYVWQDVKVDRSFELPEEEVGDLILGEIDKHHFTFIRSSDPIVTIQTHKDKDGVYFFPFLKQGTVKVECKDKLLQLSEEEYNLLKIRIRVGTTNAVTGSRGTIYTVEYKPYLSQTLIDVQEGVVEADHLYAVTGNPYRTIQLCAQGTTYPECIGKPSSANLVRLDDPSESEAGVFKTSPF